MALQAVGAAWLVEQPISSLAWYHPRLRSILRHFTKVYVCRWWMGHYMGCTPKRHICWANCRKIGGLDRGALTKPQRKEIAKIGVKSATVKVNRKGRKAYSGTSKLRSTGTYPPHFGLRLVRLYPHLIQSRSEPPEIPLELASVATQDFFDSLSWDGDLWEDGQMFSVLSYARGNEEEEDNEEDTEYPQTDVGAGFGGESEEDEPGSEAAKNNRLRRLCEIKPSGRCHVPEDVHLRWKKGGAERMALRDELESCGWDKDKFVTTLTRQREKLSKVTRTKKRGRYTKEKMRTKLGWSKKYIDDVVKYCEKKGNESLIRKDKYNRSISKYHVDVDEDDDEVSEDLEREVKVSCKDVKNPVKFKSLKPKRTREDLAPKHRDESDDDDDEPNDAEPVTGVQEHIALKKFGDSLLSKNKKLSDLSGQLDEAMAASDETSPHQDRVTKSQQNLEHAMQILETEFEAVEQTKAEVSGLQNGKLSELAAKALICKVEEQIKKSQRACAKVVTAEECSENVVEVILEGRSHGTGSLATPGTVVAVMTNQGVSSSTLRTSQPVGPMPQSAFLRQEPMAHVVGLAAAEVQENPHATRAMQEFASIRERDAEQRAHVVLEKHGLTAPIKIDTVDLMDAKRFKSFPYIKFSTWVKYLLDTGRLPRQLCACENLLSMEVKLEEFWRRYESIHPTHEIFAMRDAGTVDLRHTIPVYSHSDEGRSLKKQPLWLLSTHGALGRGTRAYLKKQKDKVPLKRCGLGLNFCGHTWSTNFLFASMLRKLYKKEPQALDNLVRVYAQDMEDLLVNGVWSSDGSTHQENRFGKAH
ncbi:unnamed protein product [Cladocopium goreaui]|uniref:Uncharacterized protein n=1 Tax=Cladocopium goreaui TaxID=2562237 RepID=A0A9P1GHG3_9DINO|nr:unnamed protein product [Cladocopium goreaui]